MTIYSLWKDIINTVVMPHFAVLSFYRATGSVNTERVISAL